jgi:hypothetical protein
LPITEAAFICGVTPAAVRKRASRARAQLREFVGIHCGLVNKSAACRCDRRVATAVRNRRVQPDDLHFARHLETDAAVGEMEQLHDLASLMRSHPDYQTPEAVNATIRTLLESGKYKLLQ